MFKKLICMTVLSFALISSPDAYASGKCNDTSGCNNVSSLNPTEQHSLTNYSPKFEIGSNIINWISSSGSVYVSARLMCSNVYYLFYPNNFVRNKIMKYWWEKVLFSDFVSAGVTTISLLSNIKCVAGFANIPIAIVSMSQFLPDVLYLLNRGLGKCGVNCRIKCCGRWIGFGGFNDNQKLDEDFTYLHALYSKNCFANFVDPFQGVDEADKIPERRRMFESLINRGQIGRLLDEGFNFTQMLNAGVEHDLLYAIMQQLQPAQLNLLQDALQAAGLQPQPVQLNVVPQPVQAPILQPAHVAALQVAGLQLQPVQLNVVPQPIQAPILQPAHVDGIQL